MAGGSFGITASCRDKMELHPFDACVVVVEFRVAFSSRGTFTDEMRVFS